MKVPTHSFPSPFALKSGSGIGQSIMRALKVGGKITALGALAPITSLALLGLLERKDRASERMSRGHDFRKVLEEAPSLAKDRAMAEKHFRTLRRVAPDISRDPVLAAGLVKKLNAYADREDGGVDPSVIQNLLMRPDTSPMKKWDVASRTLPQTKVDIASWEL